MLKSELIAQKKGEKIAQDLSAKNLSSVDAYAQAMNSSADSVKFVSFATRRIAGIGVEPKLNAMVSLAQKDQLSAPVVGNNGVYVFKVSNRTRTPRIMTKLLKSKHWMLLTLTVLVSRLFSHWLTKLMWKITVSAFIDR